MPLKKEANQLLNNRFFKLLQDEFERDYFESWTCEDSVEGRELIYQEYKAFQGVIARIEHKAEKYEPPREAA